MKKFIILFVLLLVLGGAKLSAQCPIPAPNDYPGIPFNGPNYDLVESPIGSGCYVYFEYCWRVTPWNGGEIEVYIGKILTGTGPCSTSLNSVSTVKKDAARKVIIVKRPWADPNNGTGSTFEDVIPPCPELSSTRYRIFSASCYTVPYIIGDNVLRSPCGSGNDGRCEEAWRLCFKWVNGVKIIEETVVIVNNGATCPPSIILNTGENSTTQLPCIIECP